MSRDPRQGEADGERTEALEALVAAFVERREAGERLAPEEFAREHPGHGEELLQALRALVSTESLFPSAPDLPARVGPYRVRGLIGSGGMGRVLDVEHPGRPGVPLALKLLHLTAEQQPRALERFRREAQALERIDHPGIVRVIETGVLGQTPYIAMERVSGTSLAELLRQARERSGTLPAARPPVSFLELPGNGEPEKRAVRLVARVARAVAAAHREGVLHRDLNPRNVLVRPDGEPVVIDFGLVRSPDEPTLTGSGDLLGTPQYMAPEQARGERVDERADVFGLGCILHELLTLRPPRGPGETLALLRAAGSRPLPRLRRFVRGVPRPLEVITHRATAFFPRRRYSGADELADDLERHLENQRINARAAGPLERAVELWAGHRIVASAALLLLLLGPLLWFIWPRDPPAGDLEPETIESMNAAIVPWLDGDLGAARAALDDFRGRAPGHPLLEFLTALCDDDLQRTAEEPAARALLEGERARRGGHPLEAARHFDTAWDIAPGYPLTALLRGLSAFEAGDLAGARGRLEPVAAHFGRSRTLHRTLAALYAEIGSWPDVTRALTAALQLDPGDARAWLELARAHLELGAAREALQAARRVAELGRSDLDAELEELAAELEQRGASDEARDLRAVLVELGH